MLFLTLDTDQIFQAVLALIIIVGAAIQKRNGKQLQQKAQEIHILVNSQKEILEQQKNLAEARVKELEGQLDKIRKEVQPQLSSISTERS